VTRQDAREFMALAAAIGIRSEIEVHPLTEGNEALRRIESGAVNGAAVLVPGGST
jgi:alcohol dehydrogenase, propanol-preferring